MQAGSHDAFLDHLAKVFADAGWRVERDSDKGRGADLIVRRGQRSYAVELKILTRRPERGLLQPLLADALLQARKHARSQGASPLAVVGASRLSSGLLSTLDEYVREVAPQAAWGAMDARGNLQLHGPDLSDLAQARYSRLEIAPAPSAVGQKALNPFSDLGQWMAKVLLAPRIRADWLAAPRLPLHRMLDLANAAGVSVPSAFKLLSILTRRGWVEKGREGLRVVRPHALLESWRVASARPPEEVPCAFLGGVSSAEEMLADGFARPRPGDLDRFEQAGPRGSRVCLGLFSACRALGLGFVHGAPVHVYSEDLGPAHLEAIGVHPVAHPSQAQLFVRRPKFPESVFRGSVLREGIAVADALQCFLDVGMHPARGAEQAAEILVRLKLE